VERRKHARVLVSVPVACHFGSGVAVARLGNLGVGGCYFVGILFPRCDTARLSYREGHRVALLALGAVDRRSSGLGFAIVFQWTDPEIPRLVSSLEVMSFHTRRTFLSKSLRLELDLS
jgi:hypothetical protein